MLHQFLIKKNICKIEKINLFLLFWGIKWCMFKKSGNKNVLKSWSNPGNGLFLKKCVNIRHLVFWMVTVKLSQSQQHQQHPRHTGEQQRHLHADAADARAREPGKCGAECASGPPSVFFACFNFFPRCFFFFSSAAGGDPRASSFDGNRWSRARWGSDRQDARQRRRRAQTQRLPAGVHGHLPAGRRELPVLRFHVSP